MKQNEEWKEIPEELKQIEESQIDGTEEVQRKSKEKQKTESSEKKGSRTKTRLIQRTPAKVLAFLMVILCSIVLAGSVCAAVWMWYENIYTVPEGKFRKEIYEEIADRDARLILNSYLTKDEFLEEQYEETNIIGVCIEGKSFTKWLFTEVGEAQKNGTGYESLWYVPEYEEWIGLRQLTQEEYATYKKQVTTSKNIYRVHVYVDETVPNQDLYYLADLLIELAYALRYWIYVIALAALVLAIICFIFLLCASGHRAGKEEIQPGWGTKIPFDVTTAVFLLGEGMLLAGILESMYSASEAEIALVSFLCGLGILIIFVGWSMSFSVRIKLGNWWKNTVIFRCLLLAWWIMKKVWKFVCRMGRKIRNFWQNIIVHGVKTLFHSLPLIWKTILLVAAISLFELIVIVCAWHETDIIFVAWMLEKIILIPCVLYLAIVLRRLQQSAEALSQGDLCHQADTKYMLWEFKKHGEYLNRISEGIGAAVEERLKSERMKTELITNVSHDIKTPLTSIINYSDIIWKEPEGSEKITEYAEVLHRQSERLKRLIDDLVEASKASTGNLEMNLEVCEIGIMLAQAAGEYEERLNRQNLRLMIKYPETPVKILADGRRLWRIMDNLMNNICKYAQEGTRVYLTLEEQFGNAVIIFKNISRDALDISTDELMERFVRGDSARNTEGSGLGLSIAKSLAELQNGTMELAVDGDLFKVVLTFPVVQ